MKIYLLIPVFIFCGCAKKDLNLPEASPMPIDTAKPESKPNLNLKCNVQFNNKMNIEEIAVAAAEMRRICNYSRTEIVNSAQKVF